MKILILFFALLYIIPASAQDADKIVTLTVSGQGKTIDDARTNALRSAIEQAFGTFISSKTEILNDNLVKDEIVSIANGNIQNFEVISEVQIPDGGYAISLKATVSVTKLTSFVESKGVVVEFKGGLFASNILIQELYEKNEYEAIKNVTEILKRISVKSFDYSIDAAEPFLNDGNWNIPLNINIAANENFLNIPTLLEKTIKNLTLSSSELDNYTKLNKAVFPVTLATLESKGIYYLRNQNSINNIIDFIFSLNNAITNFQIKNGVEKFNLTKYNTHVSDFGNVYPNINVNDDNFRIILRGSKYDHCYMEPASIFYYKWRVEGSKLLNFNYKTFYSDRGSYTYNIKLYKDKNDSYCRSLFKYDDFRVRFPSFYTLKEIMQSHENVGLVISFASIKLKTSLIQFKFNDIRNIDEIKKISKYEIIKQDN
jgi:hypothetical protein